MNYWDITMKEADLLLKGYHKVKAPTGISKLSLNAPNKNKRIQKSNLLVKALQENRIYIFTLLISFFFFLLLCPKAWAFFIIISLLFSVTYKFIKNKKYCSYIMLIYADISCLIAWICKAAVEMSLK